MAIASRSPMRSCSSDSIRHPWSEKLVSFAEALLPSVRCRTASISTGWRSLRPAAALVRCILSPPTQAQLIYIKQRKGRIKSEPQSGGDVVGLDFARKVEVAGLGPRQFPRAGARQAARRDQLDHR